MGAWALAARATGVSLSRQLGGTRDRIRVGISLGIQTSPAALVEQGAGGARSAATARSRSRSSRARTSSIVRAVREALGPDAPLMADANNAYTLDDADRLRGARRARPDDDRAAAGLGRPRCATPSCRSGSTTPICLDESITALDRARGHDRARQPARIVNIKPGRVGGFTASMAIHDLCAAHGIPVWCGGMLESGVGRAYNVALASLPNFIMPGRRLAQRALLGAGHRDARVDDGRRRAGSRVPLDRPGIGVDGRPGSGSTRLSVREERLRRPA